MKRTICIVWDSKAQDMIGSVLTVKNENEAIRYFGDLINNRETLVGMHPLDFELRKVGYLHTDGNTEEPLENDHILLITGERMLAVTNREQQ